MRIPLTQNKFTLVNPEDADLASQPWFAHRVGSNVNPLWYAIRNASRADNRKATAILMHRIILERKLGRPLKKGEQTDHIDHDGLNNQRHNLRPVTKSQNQQNRRIEGRLKSSHYKGVTWNKSKNRWQAQIMHNYKHFHLGRFVNETDAAKAYDEAAKMRFGIHCTLNFPEGM